MITYLLLAVLAGLIAWMWLKLVEQDDPSKPHPLDGPTRQAKLDEPLNPQDTWPFPPNKP